MKKESIAVSRLNNSLVNRLRVVFCFLLIMHSSMLFPWVGNDLVAALSPLKHELTPEANKKVDAIIQNLDSIRNTFSMLSELKNILDPQKFRQVLKFLPPEFDDILNQDPEKQQKAFQSLVSKSNNALDMLDKELQTKNIFTKMREIFFPSPWHFARYGAFFGAATILMGGSIYLVYKEICNYLSVRKSKYLLPISSIGRLDRYKRYLKDIMFGKKKIGAIVADSHMTGLFKTTLKNKEDAVHMLIFDKHNKIDINECAAAARALNLDLIAVSAVSLLQSKVGIELWNDIIQMVHKNPYKVLLVIDQAELLSTLEKEYTKHEEIVRMLASSFQSAHSTFAGRCVVVALTNDAEKKIYGPFADLCNYVKE